MSIVPDCYRLTATAATHEAWIKELDNHIQNTSPNFTHQTTVDNTGSGGDYGILINPSTSNKSWQAAIWYSNSNDELRAKIDPQDQMSDPTSRSGASAEASPDVNEWITYPGRFSESSNEEFLFAEYEDWLGMVIKSAGEGNMLWYGHLGNIYKHVWANSAQYGQDGLGILGDRSGDVRRWGEIKIRTEPERWRNPETPISLERPPVYNNGRRRPHPIVLHERFSPVGFLRTIYTWRDGFNPGDVVEDFVHAGTLVGIHDSNNKSVPGGMPWDPNVRPVL